MSSARVRTVLMVDGTLVVELSGELDLARGAALRDQLADAGASLRAINPSPLAARPLHITGAGEVLGCHAATGSPATLAQAYPTADTRANNH